MKSQKLVTAASCATVLALVVAFSPAAIADDAQTAPETGSTEASTTAEYLTPQKLVGTTFKVKGITYKITKLNYNNAANVEVVSYSGKAKAVIPATVKHSVSYDIDNPPVRATFTPAFKVTSIGANAFNTVKGHKIKKLTVGANVTYIGAKAFYKCKNLVKITYKGKAIGNAAKFGKKGKLKKSTVGKLAFKGVPRKCKAYTPSTTDWKQLQYKQGVRASMTYGGYKGIVY